jgi:hypothetical protein
MRVDSYYYIPSWSVIKTDATRGMKWATLIRNGETRASRGPGPPPRSLGKVDGWGKSHLPTLNRKVEE